MVTSVEISEIPALICRDKRKSLTQSNVTPLWPLTIDMWTFGTLVATVLNSEAISEIPALMCCDKHSSVVTSQSPHNQMFIPNLGYLPSGVGDSCPPNSEAISEIDN